MSKRRELAGVCRFCGCSNFDPCVIWKGVEVQEGCGWADVGRRICTDCLPASKGEGSALRGLRKAGYPLTAAWRTAFHRGFIVGWFAVTKRSPYGRNPHVRGDRREAWDIGERHGADARRVHITKFSAITNLPRRSVLTQPGGEDARPATRRRRDRRRRRRRAGVSLDRGPKTRARGRG